ncbi:MAG TPA: DUF2807 domain-containing protein [Rhizomicrobium sp.]|nr:DUF2807 domain-containing protein [Rhizomicrobium sp.]
MPAPRLFAALILATGLATACCSEHHDHGTAVPVAEGGVVSVPPFDSVELRGGGHVTLRYGDTQRVTLVRGSAQVTRFAIEDGRKLSIDACEDNCPSDYDLEVEIVTPRITGAAVTGGGKIVGESGFPAQGQIVAAVDGGGNVDLHAIDTETAQAAVSGGGHILVHADRELTAAVNGGGSIRYTGKAAVTSAINGGGSIEPEDSN